MATVSPVRKRGKLIKPSDGIAAKNETGPQVYSYGRFSTGEQEKGDSKRRQDDNGARKYAEKVGLPFNESLRMFDKGISAFRGAHLKKGALGKFLDLIKAGEVAPGSVLVVEDIDRLSRQEPLEHLNLFFELVKSDVSVHTPFDDTTYSRESINKGLLWKLIAKIELAHESSRRKSTLLTAAWEAKRKDAHATRKILTAKRPAWLEIDGRVKIDKRIVKPGKFRTIPDAGKSIIMLYRLAEKGLGVIRIANQLNAKAPWKPKAKGWDTVYVSKLLHSPRTRSLIGEYQRFRQEDRKLVPVGDMIPDYYPNVFAKHPGLFERVRQMWAKKQGKQQAGRNDKFSNVLQHLVKCGYCGGPMHFKDTGGYAYLFCINGRDGISECKHRKPIPSIRYDKCENAVLEHCRRLRPEQILPKKDEHVKLCQALRRTVERMKAQISDKDQRIANANELAETGTDAKQRQHWNRRASVLGTEKSDLEKQLVETEQVYQEANRAEQVLVDTQANINALQKHIENNPGVRQRLNSHLKEIIDRIEVFTSGHPTLYDERTEDGEDFEDRMNAADWPPMSGRERHEYYEFIEWVISRRMSKDGRFLRVRFKCSTGLATDDKRIKHKVKGFIDVVPTGSLAGDLDKEVVDRLRKQFQAGKRSNR